VQGATIPILWTLVSPATSSPGVVIDPTTLTSLNAYLNPSCTGVPTLTNPTQLYSSAPNPNFSYDSTNKRFQFLWNSSTQAPGCYYLLIAFNDLSSYATNVTIAPPGALNFDGTSGNTVDGTNSNLPQGNAARAIEAWINPSSTLSGTIFNYGSTTQNQGFGLAYINQHVYLIGESNDVIGSMTIPTGQWTHVAVSYDGNSASLYVNGAIDTGTLISGATGNNFATSGSSWRIGDIVGATAPSQPFVGSIDEVKAWNTARSAAQVVSDMSNELCVGQNGLVAYYKFNEGTGGSTNTGVTTLLDASSSQSNGTLNNFALTGNTSNWVVGTAPVTPDQLVIAVSPSSPTALSLASGRTSQQFTATGSCTDGSTPTLTPLTWTSSNTAAATIDNTGLATEAAAVTTATSTTISAAFADAMGSVPLNVGP
jgi:hypothetical protein